MYQTCTVTFDLSFSNINYIKYLDYHFFSFCHFTSKKTEDKMILKKAKKSFENTFKNLKIINYKP